MADHDIAAAPAAMRGQARGWEELADSMIRAHASVARLAPHAEAFSVVAASGTGGVRIAEAFAGSRDRLAGLLRQAGEEFDGMARALRDTADRYDRGDRDAADRMRGVF